MKSDSPFKEQISADSVTIVKPSSNISLETVFHGAITELPRHRRHQIRCLRCQL